jgi:uncharacterized protein YbjT (DUF2867 family)
VHLPPVLFQPMSADDVASAVGRIAVEPPINGTIEIGGPEQFRVDELVRRRLAALKDPREVSADPNARYSGAKLDFECLASTGVKTTQMAAPKRATRGQLDSGRF